MTAAAKAASILEASDDSAAVPSSWVGDPLRSRIIQSLELLLVP